MKLLIASDIHGSATCMRTLVQRIEETSPDRIVLLGDLLYHGPRNPLPQGYDPGEVARILNGMAERIIAVRGNCDAEVDQMVLDFPCQADYAQIIDGDRVLFCTHGHVHSPGNHPSLPAGSAVLSGHTHVKTLIERDGILYVNPGSTTLPKDGTPSYCTYEDGGFVLRSLHDGHALNIPQ